MATASKILKLALVQLKVGANKTENLERAAAGIKRAAERGARLVCLPECFNSPYGTQYFAEYAESIPDGESTLRLGQAAKDNNVWLIGGSIPERRSADNNRIYNTCLAFSPNGKLAGTYSKLHLFDIDVPGKMTFKESSVLTGGSSLLTLTVDDCWKVGIGICYDLRFAELAQIYSRQFGCHLLLYPGAFNMTTGVHWEALGRGRSLDNQVFVGLCAPARDTEASYVAWSHSLVVGPWGDILTSTEEKEDTIFADLDMAELDRVRTNIPISQQKRTDVYNVANWKGDTN